MTARSGDILAWLDSAIGKREETARSVGMDSFGIHTWAWGSTHLVEFSGVQRFVGPELDLELAQHVVLHDPESVLRRCAADRKAVTLYTETVAIRDRSAVTIRAAQDRGDGPDPCVLDDWSRANREAAVMLPLIEFIAEGYGWTEGQG